jgi:SAM-dependent methyltransferase
MNIKLAYNVVSMNVVTILLWIVVVFVLSAGWTSVRGAPWVPSQQSIVKKMLVMADIKSGELLYDLGSGDGRIIITAARRFGARAVGIEIDPLRYIWSQIRVFSLGLRGQVSIEYGDFFKHDLGKADIVTCYLLQDTNNKLVEKFNRELKPSTRIISNTFTLPSFPLVKEDKHNQVFLYQKPGEIDQP